MLLMTLKKKYFIKSIAIECGKAVLNLTDKPTQNIYSDRDDFASRVEWMIEHKERFGVSPNLFDGV